MIIDNTYFINRIYIANAKPHATSSVTQVAIEVNAMIEEFTRDCLIKCLGYHLFLELEAQLDITKPNGLKDAVDAKWDALLNGTTYLNSNSKNVKWRGIRFASSTLVNAPKDTSFLAFYSYYFYERLTYISKSGIGSEMLDAVNAEAVRPNINVTDAWRTFVKMVQGQKEATVINRGIGLGIDWYAGGQDITLYEFINDSNRIVPDTYADFNPKTWGSINQFGI